LSPANGNDPRTFPQIWNATADDIEQTESDVASQGSAVSVLETDVASQGSAVSVLETDVDVLQAGFVSHGTSTGGTVALNFSSGNALVSHLISGSSVAVTGVSYLPGFTRTVRLHGGTAVASLDVPADWVFVGNAAGTAIGTATTVVVTATSFGTAASQVVAAYAEEA
jgi:hypothetical protein